jgi:glycosyltransferase involved in cell wall biosynthesis
VNILLVSSDYPPNSGGIAAHVQNLGRALAANGESVTALGGYLQESVAPAACNDLESLREILVYRGGRKYFRSLKFIIRAGQAVRELSRQKWDVVHFHNFYPDGILFSLLPMVRARSTVMTNHSSDFLIALESKRNLAPLRFIIRNVNGVIGPSAELAEKSRAITNGHQSIRYIPNGVDCERFSPGPVVELPQKVRSLYPARPIILATRRHDSSKCGLEYLIRAMPSVLARHASAALVLVGDGDQTPTLKALTSSLAIENSVYFCGSVPNASLPSFYRAAYCSVLPSLYEAVSLSGLESQASGCPVIGTTVGGIPEFITHSETGLLVPPRNPGEIADALNFLLEHREHREAMASKGVARVNRFFSWRTVAQCTSDFYHETLSGANSRRTSAS